MHLTKSARGHAHSEQGARRGEHPGRSRNPLIKVADIAWLEFERPDLTRAETFARGVRLPHGTTRPGRTAVAGDPVGRAVRHPAPRPAQPLRRCGFSGVRRGRRPLVGGQGRRRVRPLPETIGGLSVELTDPSGMPVRVVAGLHELPELPGQQPHPFNFGRDVRRINTCQRPPRVPARVQRLGHLVVQSTKYAETLNWYLDNLGMIVSDFLYFPGQRDRGPTMSFIRCDRGSTPADHHTLAMALGPANRYVHSAYQVSDLDALAAGGEYLGARGYSRSWGIGRHIQGSQIFDYWRDPDGYLFEHFTDGDLFDDTLDPGWAPFTASGLAQWGPPATRDFLGTDPKSARRELVSMIAALRADNEFDINRLIGLLKVPTS